MIIIVSNATEALVLKSQLTDAGLVANVDYTWSYHPLIEDYMDPDNTWPPRVEFNFVDPALESFYSLKWM